MHVSGTKNSASSFQLAILKELCPTPFAASDGIVGIAVELELAGKVAVVTGASRGIGRAVAIKLAQEGMDLALVARDLERLKDVKAQCEQRHRKAVTLVYDLRQRSAASACIAESHRVFNKIDLLVNVAGDTKGGDFFKLTDDDWALGFELKVFGYVRMSRAAWPHLCESHGSIINIIGGNSRAGNAEFTIGGAANAALVNFTKSMADRGTMDGVRVNAINPGYLQTQRLDRRLDAISAQEGIEREQAKQRLLAWLRVPRFGEASEIADVVAFLASKRADYLQGAIVDVDGGVNRAV